MTGSEIDFPYNKRFYLSEVDEVDTSRYFNFDLLGNSLDYDVDLSDTGCGCIAALYAVRMPALDNVEDPWQYCGANATYLCPEFDMLEANKYALRSTGHNC